MEAGGGGAWNSGAHACRDALYVSSLFVQVRTCSPLVPEVAALFVGWDSQHEVSLNEACWPLFKCTLIYHHLYQKQGSLCVSFITRLYLDMFLCLPSAHAQCGFNVTVSHLPT